MHFDAQALARVLQRDAVELKAVVKHEFAHDAMRGPIILDLGEFIAQPNLWKKGVLEAP